MIDLMQRLLDEPQIDPILRVALVRKVVEAAMEGSEPLRQELGPMRSRIDKAGVDVNVPWMNPEAETQDRVRADASACVENLRHALPQTKPLLDLCKTIERSLSLTYQTVGWLARDQGGWRAQTGGIIPAQGDLWVIVMSENRHGGWKRVGTISDGKPAIDTRDASMLVVGRPVFVSIKSF